MEKSVVIRKFRKLPVVIEAVQLTDDTSVVDIALWIDNPATRLQLDPPMLWIETLEGRMAASAGDWIIKGVNGEFYPCKEDIFIKTYQEV